MQTFKKWIETVYHDHGPAASTAMIVVFVILLLVLANEAGMGIDDAWRMIMGWLE